MKLVGIFVDENNEGVYAVRFDQSTPDEFERNFDNWDDTNFVMSYFLVNEEYLKDDYFASATIDDLISKVQDEAEKLRDDFEAAGTNIQDLFKPLQTAQKKFDDATELQLAKSLIVNKWGYPQPILRIYGLRVSEKTFIITGGAIKLCHFMKSHPDTKEELNKLNRVREWLKENDVTTQDDLNYCYGE